MNAARRLFVCLCLLANSAYAGALPEFDHHDPAALNEAALQLLKVGAGGTALILLERASVLQPAEPTIRANLAALRAYLANPGALSVLAPVPAGSAEALPPAALPAPWPPR